MFEHPVCESCLHYNGDNIDGQCRRYPPSVKQTSPAYWSFPIVPCYYFCGEWEPLQIKAQNQN
jgi:hypothetical protein